MCQFLSLSCSSRSVLFSPRTVSIPLASVTSRSFSSTPGNSAVTSIASLLSAMSIFGDSVSELNPAHGVRQSPPRSRSVVGARVRSGSHRRRQADPDQALRLHDAPDVAGQEDGLHGDPLLLDQATFR